MISESKQRVRYNETDAMGLVYYGNYLIWFEIGRTDWIRRTGRSYRELETEGYILPVVESHCRYRASAFYDDEISIQTEWKDSEDLNFEFQYKIIRNADGRLLAEGWTKHLCVNKEGRIQKEGTRRLKTLCRSIG